MGDAERCRQANGAVARHRAEGDPAVARQPDQSVGVGHHRLVLVDSRPALLREIPVPAGAYS
jgi:hypothetical protein